MAETSTAEVRENQRSQLSAATLAELDAVRNRSIKAAIERLKGKATLRMGSVAESLQRAAQHIFERKSVVKGHEALAEALNLSLGFINLSGAKRYLKRANSGIIELAKHEKNPLLSGEWASRRGMRLEREAIEFVNQSQGKCKPLGKTKNVDFTFLSEEQKHVVLATLENRDRVYAIRGCAGAGKTTCLKELRKGLEAAGREAVYLAPYASAVKVLQNDGFTNATTVDSFLVKGKKELPKDAVVIIDESSLKSTEMGAAVFAAARNARILLVGDTRQHVSVETGDFLRVLERYSKLNYCELKDHYCPVINQTKSIVYPATYP
jgi:ATP-dependent exoDNAse (exonuclease V) alpha subunit